MSKREPPPFNPSGIGYIRGDIVDVSNSSPSAGLMGEIGPQKPGVSIYSVE